MTPDLDLRPPSPQSTFKRRSSRYVPFVAATLVGIASLFVLNSLVLGGPTTIERISFANGSAYDIHVAVSDGSSAMPVGTARQHCMTAFEFVLDQGDTWSIQFQAQGRDGGQITIDRSQLEADGWTFRIPDSVASQLRASGAPVPPQQSCPSGQAVP
jgi:hypothetical protein